MDNGLKFYMLLVLGFLSMLGLPPALAQRVPLPTDVHLRFPNYALLLYNDGIDTTSVDSVKSALEFGDIWASGNAAMLLARWGRIEVIPIIRSVMVEGCATEDYYRYVEHIEALAMLHDPDILSMLFLFVDSVHTRLLRGDSNGLVSGLNAIELLLDRRDYSRFQFLVDALQWDSGPEIFDAAVSRILQEAPSTIKEELYAIVMSYTSRYPSFSFPGTTLSSLEDFMDRPQTYSTLITVAESDSDFLTRWSASAILMGDHPNNRAVLHMLGRQLFSTASGTDEPIVWIDLISLFPFPDALVILMSYIDTGSDSLARMRAKYAYRKYVSQPPDSLTTPQAVLDSLIGFVDEVHIKSWLGDNTFVGELQNDLQNAANYLIGGDSIACAQQVKLFQQQVDEEYRDSLDGDNRFVTIEGWKFLYYNAQYILDRLPAIPVAPTLTTLTPAMCLTSAGAFTLTVTGTNFTNSSVVRWNGADRQTTFVSPTELQANILASDVAAVDSPQVTVQNPDGSVSGALRYYVVSALPQPVRPVLECVVLNPDSSYTAWFGYKNDNSVSVYIPVGAKNKFTPSPQDRGQTTVFQPGRQVRVFSIVFNGSNLVWTLNGRTSTASKNLSRCQ